MPSPFPGMDPYLEGLLWSDVHSSLIYTMRAGLSAVLPDRYVAKIDQYVWVHEDADGDEELLGRPDVFVTGPGASRAAAGVAVMTPTRRVKLPGTGRRTRKYIRVIDRDGGRVVTVIELLSPSNKSNPDDRAAYLAKRREYLATATNFVEVDLLRDGDRMPMGRPRPPAADYYVVVRRGGDDLGAGVWAFTVGDPLPPIPVPLNPADADARLDLRSCLDRAYDDGTYARLIDYARPPVPPLRGPDAEWAVNFLNPQVGGP